MKGVWRVYKSRDRVRCHFFAEGAALSVCRGVKLAKAGAVVELGLGAPLSCDVCKQNGKVVPR